MSVLGHLEDNSPVFARLTVGLQTYTGACPAVTRALCPNIGPPASAANTEPLVSPSQVFEICLLLLGSRTAIVSHEEEDRSEARDPERLVRRLSEAGHRGFR